VSTNLAVNSTAHDARRRIAIRGMFNLRDVGGYPCADGGRTRWRTLLRGDAPHRLTSECRAALDRFGLRAIVDLRTPDERRHAPAAWGDLPVFITHRPVVQTLNPAMTLEHFYEHLTLHCGRTLAAAVVDVSRATFTTLVHCSAGKDRTGLTIAVILAAVGVSDPDIIADYVLTSRYLNEHTPRALRQLYGPTARRNAPPAALDCPPRLLADSLSRLRERHGSISEFLLAHGATPDDLTALKRRLVATPRPADACAAEKVREPVT
jgi:protein-tyrosine phosphatase